MTDKNGGWYRCEHPEKPTDGSVRWHYHGCDACRFGARLQLVLHPDDSHVQWLGRTLGVDGGGDDLISA